MAPFAPGAAGRWADEFLPRRKGFYHGGKENRKRNGGHRPAQHQQPHPGRHYDFKEAAIIGFISGAISQIGTSMPWLGLLSETLGAVTMAALVLVPMPKAAKPLATTLITTLVSGFAFVGLAAMTYANPMPAAQFVSMATVSVVTAVLNCVIVLILSIPVGGLMNQKR